MRRSALSILVGLLFSGLPFGVQSAHAAAGSLDTTFGTGGVTITTLTTTASDANGVFPAAVQLQSDGKILVLANVTNLPSITTDVLRYTTAGLLDATFGNKGIAVLPTVLGSPAMAVQSNGQIVVVGAAAGSNVLAAERLNTNGTVDTTFGTDGLASTSLNCCGTEMAVVIEPSSGDIVACTQLEPTGRRQPFHTALARFLSTGAVDTTFGSGGTVNVAGVGGCAAVAVLSTGEVLVENGPSAQFTSAGVQESTVTGGSIVAAGATHSPPSIFLSNGDYLVAQEVFTGEESRGHNAAAQVLRFTLTGASDTTFDNQTFHFVGTGGSGIEAQPNAIALQSNGDIVVVGQQTTASQGGTVLVNGLARLTANGAPDTTFGSGGTVTNTVPANTQGLDAVAIDSQGRIITVGIANSFTELTVSRYLGQ